VLDLGLRSGVGSGVAVGVAGIGIGGRVEREAMVTVDAGGVFEVGVFIGWAVGGGVAARPLQAVRASRISTSHDNQCNLCVPTVIPPSLSEQDTS